MTRPRLQRAATARQEKIQLPIAEQNFSSDKGATDSQPSSATPLKNMANSLGRFSAEPASLVTS
jgi:hypothetical protein